MGEMAPVAIFIKADPPSRKVEVEPDPPPRTSALAIAWSHRRRAAKPKVGLSPQSDGSSPKRKSSLSSGRSSAGRKSLDKAVRRGDGAGPALTSAAAAPGPVKRVHSKEEKRGGLATPVKKQATGPNAVFLNGLPDQDCMPAAGIYARAVNEANADAALDTLNSWLKSNDLAGLPEPKDPADKTLLAATCFALLKTLGDVHLHRLTSMEKIASLERMLEEHRADSERKLRRVSKEASEEQARLQHRIQDLTKKNSLIQSRDSQLKHELRRKDGEIRKLQDSLAYHVHAKTSKGADGGGQVRVNLLNPLRPPKSDTRLPSKVALRQVQSQLLACDEARREAVRDRKALQETMYRIISGESVSEHKITAFKPSTDDMECLRDKSRVALLRALRNPENQTADELTLALTARDQLLLTQLANMEQQNAALQEKLQERTMDYHQRVETQAIKYDKFEQSCRQMAPAIRQVNDECKMNAKLQAENEEIRQENARLAAEAEESRRKEAQIRQENAEALKAVDAVQQQLLELEAAKLRQQEMLTQVTHLEQDLEQAQIEIEELRLENDEFKKANEDFKRENDSISAENEDFKKANDEFKRENDLLKAENDDLEAVREELQRRLEQLEEQLEQRHDSGGEREELERLQAERLESQARLAQLEEAKSRQDEIIRSRIFSETEQIQAERASMRKRTEELEKRVQELQETKARQDEIIRSRVFADSDVCARCQGSLVEAGRRAADRLEEEYLNSAPSGLDMERIGQHHDAQAEELKERQLEEELEKVAAQRRRLEEALQRESGVAVNLFNSPSKDEYEEYEPEPSPPQRKQNTLPMPLHGGKRRASLGDVPLQPSHLSFSTTQTHLQVPPTPPKLSSPEKSRLAAEVESPVAKYIYGEAVSPRARSSSLGSTPSSSGKDRSKGPARRHAEAAQPPPGHPHQHLRAAFLTSTPPRIGQDELAFMNKLAVSPRASKSSSRRNSITSNSLPNSPAKAVHDTPEKSAAGSRHHSLRSSPTHSTASSARVSRGPSPSQSPLRAGTPVQVIHVSAIPEAKEPPAAPAAPSQPTSTTSSTAVSPAKTTSKTTSKKRSIVSKLVPKSRKSGTSIKASASGVTSELSQSSPSKPPPRQDPRGPGFSF